MAATDPSTAIEEIRGWLDAYPESELFELPAKTLRAAVDDFDELLAASSLGSPEALAIRARTPADVSERFMRKVALAEQAAAPETPDFFEDGKTYIRRAPWTPPELLEIFSCVVLAKHPAKNEPRAFGFEAHAFPGNDWISAAMGPAQWADGWTEYDLAAADAARAAAGASHINPESKDA